MNSAENYLRNLLMVSEPKKKSSHQGIRRDYGKPLVKLTLALVLIGLAMVYSASAPLSEPLSGDSEFHLLRQAQKALVGIVLMMFFAKFDYRKLRKYAKPFLWASVGLLLGLLIIPEESSLIGEVTSGQGDSEKIRRWYYIFGMSFQPSEFAKFAVILWAAHTAVIKSKSVENFMKGTLPFLIVMGVISILIVLEPDLSQAFLIAVSLFAVLYLAGSKSTHLLYVVLAGLLLLGLFCYLEPYRWERILAYLGISGSSQGVNYQGDQSQIAIGSGGLVGLGWGAGRQKMRFLPEAHKDFIFAIIGEEFGLLGGIVLITGYACFAYFGFKIARAAKDRFGYYLSSGLVVMIILGAILHMLVVEVMVPATGLTLPFISYGGSSLVVSLASVGVLRSVAKVSAGKVRTKAGS
jgi:cell division protein FtsW